MGRCHPRFKTPHVSTVVTGVVAALVAGVFPLDVLADLISIGILLAFAVVCLGVLVLRHTRPDVPRPFRVPWAPFTCVLGTLVCLGHDPHALERHVDAAGRLDHPRHLDLRALRFPQQPAAQMSRTLASTPAADGFWMPAEFEPHRGCWLLWPERPDNWREAARPAQRAFAQVALAIAQFEPVTVGVSPAHFIARAASLDERVRLVEMAHDDGWMRDVGPTCVVDRRGDVRGVDWHFNAWGGLSGGLYFPWDQDDLVARKVLEIEGRERYRAPLINEGGAIHVDGRGHRARDRGVPAQRQPQSRAVARAD